MLPLISKILENTICDQTNAFLKGSNLLYSYQSGFRTNHSTNLCLSFLTDKILKGFDEGLSTGMILIDFQETFDTINHKSIFKKLKSMGFSEGCIAWLQSYLSERIFSISIENQLSTMEEYRAVFVRVKSQGLYFPYLFQCHASSCERKFAFIYWRFMLYVPTKTLKKLKRY